MIENAYRILYICIAGLLGIAIGFALLRSVKGPRIADRIVGINMIGTLSVLCIAVVAYFLKEDWLLDVCVVYGLISFLTIVVLSIMHIDEKRNGKEKKGRD